jgi:RNA polymerase sigma factor (sigma-70 family)
MTRREARSVLQYLNQFIGPPAGSTDSDARLLQRFAERRDEAAFAELVRRHGRLVWSVCRRLLGHEQDAEDAFQATFIVLADKAASIRKRKSLASWLYGVAARTAWNARKSARRRRCRERHAEQPSSESPVSAASLRELQTLLDEEVRRLPEQYQAPFLLCCLEGKGRAEAARQLGWKEGTVSSRLALARERLQKRLARRGVTLSAALCAGALSSEAVSASVPLALRTAAARIAAGAVSERVIHLAKGVLKSMIVARLKAGVALVLILGGLAAGGAAALRQIETKKAPQPPHAAVSKPAEQRRTNTDLHGDPLPPGAVARLGTTRFRAGAGIYSIAFSPDGKTIASSSNEVTAQDVVRLWDAASGKQIRVLATQWSNSHAFAFSPDGKTLAIDQTLHDVGTGKLIRQMTPPRRDLVGTATSVAFSPDGKLLASGHGDKTARLWDVATGKQLQKLDVCDNNRVSCVAFSPDGKTLATGGHYEEHALRLWDVATGAERYGVRGNVHGEIGGVEALAFAPDGKTLVTAGGNDKDIRLWDAATGRELRKFHGHTSAPSSLALSPDGKQLVSGRCTIGYGGIQDRTVRVWDVATGRERRQLSGHQGYECSVAFSPNGNTIATGGWDSCILLWDARSGKPLVSRPDSQGGVQSIVISLDGKTIATQAGETIHIWEAAKGKELRRLPGGGGITLSPDGKLLASAEGDGFIRLWDAHTGQEQRQLHGHKGKVTSITFAPDGKTLASGGADGTTRFWNLEDGTELRQMIGRTPGLPPKPQPGMTMPPMPTAGGKINVDVDCLAFAPDGKTIASGCSDYTVRIWQAATGKQVYQLAEQGPVTAVTFSLDGRMLASANGWDNKIRLWEMASGKVRLEIDGHADRAALAFSPDGRILALPGWGEPTCAYLWDTRTGKLWGRLGGHRGPIESLAWSRDGTRLATGSTDTTVLLWDMSNRTPQRSRQLLSLSPRELEELWRQMGTIVAYSGGPVPAFSWDVWRLSMVPEQSVPFLAQRLRPKVLDLKKVPQWIADLDSKDRAVFERAFDNLFEIGEDAKPALRKALKKKHTPQGQELIEDLLEGSISRNPSVDEARELKAVEVLRLIDNDESRATLKKLAGGTPGAPLTQAAAAALKGKPRKPNGGGYR